MKTGYKVGDVMTSKPVCIKPEEDLVKCAQEMAEQHVGAILVKEHNKVLGILTEQDIVRKVIGKRQNPLRMKVGEVMEKNLTTVGPDADIFDAVVKMRDLNIRHLPVIAKGEMVGLLTLKDVLKIQPQLFELIVDKFEIKESSRKPAQTGKEGICQQCGNYSEQVSEIDGVLFCKKCRART